MITIKDEGNTDEPKQEQEPKQDQEAQKKETVEDTYQELLKKVTAIEALVLTDRIKPTKAIIELLTLSSHVDKMPQTLALSLHSANTQSFCTRIAQIYCRLFFDMSWKPDRQDMIRLMIQKRFMNFCFELSGFWSSNFLVDFLKKRTQEIRQSGRDLANNQAGLRLVVVSNIAELDPETLVEMTSEENEIIAILTIGLLLDVIPITLTGESNRRFLLESSSPFHKLETLPAYSQAISNVWMLCSYSTTPKKHLIKERLNEWYRRCQKATHLKLPTPGSIKEPGNTEGKPVLAIAAERFTSSHAVYRWYARIIQKFKQHFYLVLVALEENCDEKSRALFDRCVILEKDSVDLRNIVNQCSPDIVYYPSIGMCTWSIALANQRWGTLQLMSLGHPASSFSDCIDGVFTGSAMFGGVDVCTENQLILESRIGATLTALEGLQLPEPTELPKDVIKIAIPCNAMKINLPFLAALKEIESQAETPIQFTFFPYLAGLSHLSTTHRIQTYFQNAKVQRKASYQNYINELNNYHFAISPFPFGNATSTIDCLTVGLPVLAMIGSEPHSRTDFITLEAFDLQDFCVADSIETYVYGAVQWINNPNMLQQLRELVASKKVGRQEKQNAKEGDEELSNEYSAALKWAWENHEFMRNNRQLAIEATGNWA